MSNNQESDSEEEETSKECHAWKLLDSVAKEIERLCKVAEDNTTMDENVRKTTKEVSDAGKESRWSV